MNEIIQSIPTSESYPISTEAASLNLNKLLSSYCRSERMDAYYYPHELYGVYRLASYLFESFPFVRVYEKLNISKIKDYIYSSGFAQLIESEEFRKEDKNYIGDTYGFVNLNEKIFVYIKNNVFDGNEVFSENIGNSLPLVHLVSRSVSSKRRVGIGDVHVFYIKGHHDSYLNEFIRDIESIALSDFKMIAKKNTVNFLCFSHGGFNLRNIKINKRVIGDLTLNYGEEFDKVNNHLIQFLESDETGLTILHGGYGNGKTFYIRHLLSTLTKRTIYVPPNLIGRIAEPDFLSFLLNQNDFILVIEDAEEVIATRKNSSNPAAVANLLNLTDGILGDCIKIKVIVTFNCDIEDIDPALLRKGRLRLQYEFKKLSSNQANKLFKFLNINHQTNEPMSINDIYNWGQENFRKEKIERAVGFSIKQ